MSLTEQMRKYILNAKEPPTYKQMRIDLRVDSRTAQKSFMVLFNEGFCKALAVEGELRIFQNPRGSASSLSSKLNLKETE